MDPASKKKKKKNQPQHYNKAFYGKVRQVHSRLTGTSIVEEKRGSGAGQRPTTCLGASVTGPRIPPLSERHLQVNRSVKCETTPLHL